VKPSYILKITYPIATVMVKIHSPAVALRAPRSMVLAVCDSRDALRCIYNAVVINSINLSISSVKSRIRSIFRKVHKGSVPVPSRFGLWSVELAMSWWYFARCEIA
jgi:hypothetical protein